MTQPTVAAIAPFFIVRNVTVSIAFYRDKLGFSVTFQEPAQKPFFAVIQRDNATIFLKAVGSEPIPNHIRHPDARWDAYLYVPDPDALAAEFTSRGVTFSVPLEDTHDGLRGFELEDADGYVLFFGRTRGG